MANGELRLAWKVAVAIKMIFRHYLLSIQLVNRTDPVVGA